jgi:hypothetical protein
MRLGIRIKPAEAGCGAEGEKGIEEGVVNHLLKQVANAGRLKPTPREIERQEW